MTYTLALIFTSAILLPAVAGLVRYRRIDPVFRPFLWAIWLGALTEILSYVLTHNGHSNAVIYNIYVLLESVFFTMQFRNWGLFKSYPKLFGIICGIFIIGWTGEMLIPGRIQLTTSYFRIGYSFILVLMSIQTLNKQLLLERSALFKNAIFLISFAFIVYFTYKVITGMFTLYGLGESRDFRIKVVTIMIWINLFTKLIFGIAILCMPRKIQFSMPF